MSQQNLHLQCSEVTLTDLPVLPLEKIFSFLSFQDITRFRGINCYFYDICTHSIRRGILKLKVDIEMSINRIHDSFMKNSIQTIEERGDFFRNYNMLETLRLELNMIMTLNRHILNRNDKCFPIGSLLDHFYELLYKIQRNNFGPWSTVNPHIIDLQFRIKRFLDNMENIPFSIHDYIPMGVQIMDLLDLFMDSIFDINVIYSFSERVCYITGHYVLTDAKFLNYSPDIPLLSECLDRKLTAEESSLIVKYLILLVKVHNRLLINEEQYLREIELIRRANAEANDFGVFYTNRLDALSKPPREYQSFRHYTDRKIIDVELSQIKETYRNYTGTANMYNEGLNCRIYLTCTFTDAPLQITHCLKNLIEDVKIGHGTVRDINPDVLEKELEEKSAYSLILKLDVCIPLKTSVQLKFRDGAAATA